MRKLYRYIFTLIITLSLVLLSSCSSYLFMSPESAAEMSTNINKPTTLETRDVVPTNVRNPSGKKRKKRKKDIKANKPTVDTLNENLVQIDMATQKVEVSAHGDFETTNNTSGKTPVGNDQKETPLYNFSEPVIDASNITAAERKWIVVSKFNPNQKFNTVQIDLDKTNIQYPINNSKRSSPYGMRGRGWHSGLDLTAAYGEPIMAVMAGVVRLSRVYAGYGNVIVVKHHNGIESIYAHNSKNIGTIGMKVKAGDVIALCGRTGRATGNHLHFEMRVDGVSFDPELMFNTNTKAKYTGIITVKKELNAKKLTITRNNQLDNVIATKKNQFDNPYVYPNANTKPKTNYVASNSSDGQYHTVVSGDTLSQIAVRYKTTVKNICAINNMTPNTTLRLNKKIRIK